MYTGVIMRLVVSRLEGCRGRGRACALDLLGGAGINERGVSSRRSHTATGRRIACLESLRACSLFV